MMSNSRPDKPLNGVRVLDLSQYIPGPYASLKLLQLGAEVIKVEPPAGDPMRLLGMQEGEISPLYFSLNRGKKIVKLNLKAPEERQTLLRLVADANILLEGFRPGTLERLGLPYQVLHQINPALVICSLSGYGQSGEYSQRAGHDLGYGALAGLYSQQAERGKPQIIYPPVADHAAALNALAMINAALYQQATTSRGSVLDISIFGTLSDWQYMLEDEGVAGQLSGDLACYQVYRTADGRYLTLAALEAKFWGAFCQAVDHPEWLGRQDDSTPQHALIQEVNELFASRTLAEWQQILRCTDCCFEVIPTTAEILDKGQQEKGVNGGATSPISLWASETINWSD